MTPRVDVVALAAPVRYADVVRVVRRSGHSHFPVYEDDLDHLLGVLFVKDLFQLGGSTDATGTTSFEPDSIPAGLDVTARLREPYVIPESRSALEVLADMRRSRRGVGVVVDEYGGFAGILTIKDLVSELVGDLRDEFDRSRTPVVQPIDANRYLVDGACSIDEVRDETGVVIPDGEYVTLGGYIFDVLGHIPIEGEEFETAGSRFRVTRMDRRRIAKVVIQTSSATLPAGEDKAISDGK
jgi:CBS domain containing-hemolysin-like protein